MFHITQTFMHETGFHITPIEMEGMGFIFLPKEFEKQLGYENLARTLVQSESFAEGIEYTVLRKSNLRKFKELLNRINTIDSVPSLKHSSALILLTESGLHNLLTLSRKPNIQGFRKWVTAEVLPVIRPSDMYMANKFNLTRTFTNDLGFRVTPIEMQSVGFIFLPNELEEQLGYEDLARLIIQSESFAEGIEYAVLKDSNLRQLKKLVNKVHSMDSVHKHTRALVVLTEAGLYTVVMLSRKPNAIKFRRWVTSEILPSIRTGMYNKLPNDRGTIEPLPEFAEIITAQIQKNTDQQQVLQQSVGKLTQILAQHLQEQQQFQNYTLFCLEQIEEVLADCKKQHDPFDGWKKIKKLVDDMTEIYKLSNKQRQQYFYDLCQKHQIDLPEKAVSENETSFSDTQEIARKIGLYSTQNKPHTRLVSALIHHLELGKEQYCREFPVARQGYRAIIPKYSSAVIIAIQQWLENNDYPKEIVLLCRSSSKTRRYRVKYRSS